MVKTHSSAPDPSATIYVGSSEDLLTLVPEFTGQVALCVTSPPYHNAISYETHQSDRTANYRARVQVDYAEEYLRLLGTVWAGCHSLLRPGGYLAINVGTVLDGGFHFPLPQDIQAHLVETRRWEFCRAIAWNKVTAGVKRAGSVIQHRLPGYYYPNLMTEHILVFRKPGPAVHLETEGIPPEWWESIWDLAPVPPKTVDHPAPFPEDLPHRLIRMLTLPGDLVLDPFNGAGATTKAAHDLGRRGIGIDLSTQYVAYAQDRLTRPSSVRRHQLLVEPVAAAVFRPGRSRGRTRHGSGLDSRDRKI